MKKLFLMLMCCVTASWCLANNYRGEEKNYKYSLEKEIARTFDVASNPELEIDGKYSDIIVTTWEKPQIAFKINVLVKCDKEQRAQERLDDITIAFSKEGNKVEAETVIANSNVSFNGSMSIKYYVSVPADVLMELETKYGDITVDAVAKNFKVDIKYGDFKADKLLAMNEIDIDYGDFNISYAKNLELELKYGNGIINKVQRIDAELGYSDLKATEISKGVFHDDYSKLTINKIDDIELDDKYSETKIAKMGNGKMKVDADYSELNVTFDSAYPNAEIEGNYSDIRLTINEKAAFNYDIKVDSGDIIADSVFGRIDGGHIVGKFGSGNYGNIKVRMNYGDFRINK